MQYKNTHNRSSKMIIYQISGYQGQDYINRDYSSLEAATKAVEDLGSGNITKFSGVKNIPFALPETIYRATKFWTYSGGAWFAMSIHDGEGRPIQQERPH
jgi:hypothetical protein